MGLLIANKTKQRNETKKEYRDHEMKQLMKNNNNGPVDYCEIFMLCRNMCLLLMQPAHAPTEW